MYDMLHVVLSPLQSARGEGQGLWQTDHVRVLSSFESVNEEQGITGILLHYLFLKMTEVEEGRWAHEV
jgi:hypothetical protein